MASRGVVVIGGGQAGFQLAASLRERGYQEPVAIVCGEAFAPYQRPPLSKAFLTDHTDHTDHNRLLLRPLAFYEQHAIRLISGDAVIEIDRAVRRVSLSSGSALDYDYLVFATGARNRVLQVPGADLDGVCYLRTIPEAELLRDRLAAAKEVAIIGAGFIGLELSAVASKLGKHVRIFDLAPRVLSRSVSQATSDFFAFAHRQWGAELVLGAGIREIRGSGGQAREIATDTGADFPADIVLAGVGVVPNVELAAGAGLPVENGIAVDARLQTPDEAISAIGDCASFPFRFANGRVRLESVQNAADQARCVAARITGHPADYDCVPWFWSDQQDLKLQMVGLAANCDRTVLVGDPAARKFSNFCFSGGVLRGIESVNQPGDHMAGRRLLAGNVSLTPEEAAAPGFNSKAHLAAHAPA